MSAKSTATSVRLPIPPAVLDTTAGSRPAHNPPVSRLASTDLFRSCAAGNCEKSWREFVARFHSRLVSAVRRSILRLGMPAANRERVEDLVQEIYCRILGIRGRLCHFRGSSEAQLMTYLQRVAQSVVVDEGRVNLARKRSMGLEALPQEWRLASSAGSATIGGPEDRILAAERRRAFLEICHQALGRRASPITVRVARLAILEGWTSREIAAGLGGRLEIAGVDSLIYRLRRKLSDRGIELPRRDRRCERRTESPPVATAGRPI